MYMVRPKGMQINNTLATSPAIAVYLVIIH